MIRSGLPVDAVLPRIADAARACRPLVVTAEPGAGKSTVVPLALLEPGVLPPGKIVMLEPRRIAARAAARRMASLLNEPPGKAVGYRTRFETLVSADTRIEVVTEALLTRMIQKDPSLEGVSAVIFDEFHERSIHADLALALTLDARSILRDDLRIALMSATLDADSAAGLLGNDTEIVNASGRCFEVGVSYAPLKPGAPVEPHAASVVLDAMQSHEGDALVFLPGEAEIRRTAAELASMRHEFEVLPLYGSLSAAEQDRVFVPSDRRRIILATPVAETSITIPGIRIVVDSGLARMPFFSPASGMDQLRTVRISKASAEQRRGRAGRTAPGVCIRLWHEYEQNAMPDFAPPEIEHADLTELALELAQWGVVREKADALPWMTPPPEVKLDYAFDLLTGLGAISAKTGQITPHGKLLHRLPVHPRLANAILFADAHGLRREALMIAAILSDRDPLLNPQTADLAERLAVLDKASAHPADRQTLFRIRQVVSQLEAALPRAGAKPGTTAVEAPPPRAGSEARHSISRGLVLAAAYPDRIARRRSGGDRPEYLLSNGMTAKLGARDPLRDSEYLAVADSGGLSGQPTIRLALPLDIAALEASLPDLFRTRRETVWDDDALCVRVFNVKAVGSLTVERKPSNLRPGDDTAALLIAAVRKRGFASLGISPAQIKFLRRIQFLHVHGCEGFPDCSEQHLLDTLEDWLAPHLDGVSRLDRLADLDYRSVFAAMLPPKAQSTLNSLAPERFEVPSGSHIAIDYSDPAAPMVRVKLQEVFGLAHSPKIAGGRVPLVFDLLSPAMRTVQITRDLDEFWDGSYFLVRKDMRGRYPKHNWPEDPRTEPPSRSSIKRPKKA
ncbi:MAG: ATP-dependent helicase HrpB [Lentisphaeria bacterium]|nr:ATP-dependent helicase HrpB [Lentisphaeria bacterium]